MKRFSIGRNQKEKNHKLKLLEKVQRSLEVICVLFTKSFGSMTKALAGIRRKQKSKKTSTNLKSAHTYIWNTHTLQIHTLRGIHCSNVSPMVWALRVEQKWPSGLNSLIKEVNLKMQARKWKSVCSVRTPFTTTKSAAVLWSRKKSTPVLPGNEDFPRDAMRLQSPSAFVLVLLPTSLK